MRPRLVLTTAVAIVLTVTGLAVAGPDPIAAAPAEPALDLTRPRILGAGVPVDDLRARLVRDPYARIFRQLHNRAHQADAIPLDDHTIGSQRTKAKATKDLAFEYALDRTLPLVFVSGSGGGARMYEGALSLMQMAKTSAAISRFSDAGGLYISVLTNPTMAGVMASFAALGDVTIAEPRALIGFTGPRVIEQTIRQELPKGFQTSEFLLEHGFIDMIVERPKLRTEVARLIDYLT